MKVCVTRPQNIGGTYILLPPFTNERLHLENCADTSNESNIVNSNQPFPLPWNIQFEILNKNTNKIFRFRKVDPIVFFMLHNNEMEELDIKYKTINTEGNQNKSFRVTTCKNCKNRNISISTNTRLRFT